MKTYILSLVCSILGVLICTPLMIRIAVHFGVVDVPDARRVNKRPVARMGGVAIFVASLGIVVAVSLIDPFPRTLFAEAWGVMFPITVAAAVVFGLGLADDVLQLRGRTKLLVLLAAAIALCASGVRVQEIGMFNWFRFSLGWWSWPLTVLWLIGITVAMNFIDGLDGLAAGIALIASAVICVAAMVTGNLMIAITALTLCGSLAGFLVFNFNPARIFMGDCGSMYLGFLIAAMAIPATAPNASGQPHEPALGMLLTALSMAVPLLDAVYTFVRRGVIQRRSIFAAERGHIHHHLLNMGLNQKQAVLILYGVTLLSAGSGLFILFRRDTTALAAVGILMALSSLILFKVTGYVQIGGTMAAFRRNLETGREQRTCRDAYEVMQLRFPHAVTFDDWWKEVCAAGEMMELKRIRMALNNRDESRRELLWESDLEGSGQTLDVIIPIKQRRTRGEVRAAVTIEAATSLELAGQRVTYFARLMDEFSLASLRDDARLPRSQEIAPLRPQKVVTALEGKSVAIVHDFLYTYAGAERVLEQMLHVAPHADVFSLFDFLAPADRGFLMGKEVKTSFIQRWPFARTKHRHYLPLMPMAIEQLDMSKYDVVISSSYCVAKGVITRPDQLHICYCHSPVRFAWDLQHQYLRESGLHRGIKSVIARAILHYIRNWDARSCNSVDCFVTNSRFVGRRIEKFYRRSSVTVYPPVDTDRFELCMEKEDYYLTASRLVPYKRIDMIVEAFSRTPNRRLIVIGDGPDMEKIKAKAGPNVKLLGYQSNDRMKSYMQRARAFVFAAEEDFGIVPVEAQACGTPVLAFARGGVTESVVDGVTGILFPEQTIESLLEGVDRFEKLTFRPQVIRRHAEQFSTQRFRQEFATLAEREWALFRARSQGTVGVVLQDETEMELTPEEIARRAESEEMVASNGQVVDEGEH